MFIKHKVAHIIILVSNIVPRLIKIMTIRIVLKQNQFDINL